jgi:hypothetical protein
VEQRAWASRFADLVIHPCCLFLFYVSTLE